MANVGESSEIGGANERSLAWKIISLLSRHRWTLIGLSALIFITAGLDIAVPFFARRLIDEIVRSLSGRQGHAMRTLIISAVGIFAVTAATRILRVFL